MIYCNNCGIEIITPSNYCFECGANTANKLIIYTKAPLWDRFLAMLIDVFFELVLAIPAIIFLVIGVFQKLKYQNIKDVSTWYFLALLFYMIPLTYSLIKDGLGQGQSWGKKAMGLMVVHLDFNIPCTKSRSFFRNLITRFVSLFPLVGWLIEPVLVIASSGGRKLGDLAAETMVIVASTYIE